MAFSAANPDWSMKFRLLEAEVLTYQGRRSEVISLLNCADASYPATGDIAIKRYLLCVQAHARMGHAALADRELHQAIELSERSGSRLKGEVLRTEAQVQVYRSQQENAEQLFRRSLQVARTQNDAFLEAADLLNLGMAAVELRHYDQALPLLHDSAARAKSIQAGIVMEAALGDAGLAYLSLGDYEKALATFLQAESQAKQIGTTSAQVNWLRDAGTAYYNLHDVDSATATYQQALYLARRIDDYEQISATSTQLGFLLYDKKQFAGAKTRSDEALVAARKAADPQDEAEALFLQAIIATQQPDTGNAGQLLRQVLQKSSAIPSQQSTIQNELANFYNTRHQPQQAGTWYRKSIATFEADRAAVRDEELRLPFFANGETIYRQYADFLIDTGRQQQALQLLDQGRAKTLSEGLDDARPAKSAALTPQTVAKSQNATLLFYSLGPKKSCLWAINAQRSALYALPKAAEIDARIQAYNKAIQKSADPLQTKDENALSLYATLVAPAQSMLPPGSRVIVIPDGTLNSLNFETLLVPGSQTPQPQAPHYWIEDATVVNANAIRLLATAHPTRKKTGPDTLLLIGNPLRSTTDYAALPDAATEITGIQQHFNPQTTTTLAQAQAIPAAYALNHPEKFSYIHFVAHGTASRLSPLDSAVVLSAPAGRPDDFKLYAREIVRHPLHAKLVTISACYGSGLRAYAGEGLIGLSWSFLRAGAHNVIGALWEVNDSSTPQLMDHLYASIQAGKQPDQALRDAKLTFIHSTGVYRKPLYWAAFQLYAGS